MVVYCNLLQPTWPLQIVLTSCALLWRRGRGGLYNNTSPIIVVIHPTNSNLSIATYVVITSCQQRSTLAINGSLGGGSLLQSTTTSSSTTRQLTHQRHTIRVCFRRDMILFHDVVREEEHTRERRRRLQTNIANHSPIATPTKMNLIHPPKHKQNMIHQLQSSSDGCKLPDTELTTPGAGINCIYWRLSSNRRFGRRVDRLDACWIGV